MKKSNYKDRSPTMFPPGMELYKLTPGKDWRGAKRPQGSIELAVLVDGKYCDEEGGKFCMGDGSWVLVEDSE